jgi:hypothetical protein
MMKQISVKVSVALGLAIATVGTSVAQAHDHGWPTNFVEGREVCEGFAPANTMKIPVGMKGANRFAMQGGITEAEFNTVLDRIQELYADEVKARGAELKINRRWTDATVNASAQQMGTTWVINMYGGLARHTTITKDGFALVACHEMGHHLGGAPKIEGWFGDNWATNEGGSDYYGTLKCARRYFAKDDNAEALKTIAADPTASAKCREQFSNVDEQNLCIRSSAAAQSVTGLLATLSGDTVMPKFDAPDKKVVSRMDDAHPAAQCRLDTYYAGVGCKADVSTALSDTDFRPGSCISENDTFGFRPLCWFKPN